MHRLFPLLTLCLLSLLALPAIAADGEQIVGILQPAVSPNGAEIAFSWQGDIWIVATSGGIARRLTDHPGFDGSPVWSDDGQQIAFTSNRRGGDDIWRISRNGGEVWRCTWSPFGEYVTDWRGDQLLFASRRDIYSQDLYTVTVPRVGDATATPIRLTVDMSRHRYARFSPDGTQIVSERGVTAASRREYTGSSDRDVVVLQADGTGMVNLTHDNETFDGFPVWGSNDQLFFISDRDGWGRNIFRMQSDGSKVTKLTNYSKAQDGPLDLAISRDGSTLVYELRGRLYRLPIAGGAAKAIPIQVASESKRAAVDRIRLADATEMAPSPDGKFMATVVRGDILISPVIPSSEVDPEDSPRYGEPWNCTNSPWRDYHVDWHPDGDKIVYLTDGDGDFEVTVMDLNTKITTQITRDDVNQSYPKFSPDGKWLSWFHGNRELVVTKADGSSARTIGRGFFVMSSVHHVDYSWSPDSRWIAFESIDTTWENDIWINRIDGSQEQINATNHYQEDWAPLWSEDGQYLYFVSSRGNPGDLDPRASQVYRMQLTRRPPPFSDEYTYGKADKKKDDAKIDEVKKDEAQKDDTSKEDAENDDDADSDNESADETATDDNDNSDKAEPDDGADTKSTDDKLVEIDFAGLDTRVEQISRTAGSINAVALSHDGKYVIYTASPLTSAATYAVRTADGNTSQISGSGADDIQFSADGKRIFYLNGGSVRGYTYSGGRNRDGLDIDHSNSKDLNHAAEYEQMYTESWRALKQGFYDKKMHGTDWDALHKKYLPLARSAATPEEFYGIINLLLGELQASHLGAWGGNSFSGIGESGATLGLEFANPLAGQTGLTVTDVLWRGPTDLDDSRVEVGERVLSVNGTAVGAESNIWRLLENMHYRTVVLEVEGTDGVTREVKVWPISTGTANDLRYDEWVEENRQKVEDWSGGKLAYIHIRGMNQPSLNDFYNRLYTTARDADGLVLDIRFNGGGNIHEQLLDALNRPPLAIGQVRDEPTRVVQPAQRWGKPIVLLINEMSFSDSEIFPSGFRDQGLGTIVGVPTGGGVIGTVNYTLVDGVTSFRIPLMGWYTLDGRNMENYGIPPDIYVENDPNGYREGEDAQLKTAVEELLK